MAIAAVSIRLIAPIAENVEARSDPEALICLKSRLWVAHCQRHCRAIRRAMATPIVITLEARQHGGCGYTLNDGRDGDRAWDDGRGADRRAAGAAMTSIPTALKVLLEDRDRDLLDLPGPG